MAQKRYLSTPGAGDGLPSRGNLPRVRQELGRLGGSLMIIAVSVGLPYLFCVVAQGQPSSHAGKPSPHLIYPVWPFFLCASMLAVGGVLYGWAHRWRVHRWETKRALRRRAAAAETALASARDELEKARSASSAPEPKPVRLILEIHYRLW
jgi:hypothetical protein